MFLKKSLGKTGICGVLCLGLAAVSGAEALNAPGGSWFSSEKIYQEGDLVTVIVSETSQGVQSASTDLNKSTSLGLATTGLLSNSLASTSAGLTSAQKGGGNLAREGKMTAMITTRVEKVLPNGTLAIAGTQEIEFDSGVQRISVKGVARPRDIDSANRVYSYRLANAKIEYLGTGALNEKARTGYISRLLEWLWIF
jgi:flagellar L-ring protein precursor FlgH